ncbi:unnamed protein product [Ceutorhynchus assimilis]|uniref:Uncharacterized protein n=1 Tax=Ceutorhynchus assimilis TaxID=467358 RepID=A0A9N9QFI9_9CUCU|nr:unnamed protein product [Ceutorhynchus assimilis]
MNKFVIYCALVFLVAVVCHGYNFEDNGFNQILYADSQEFVSSLSAALVPPRLRRDNVAASANGSYECERPFPRLKLCCGEDSLRNIDKDNMYEECFKEVTGYEVTDELYCEEFVKKKSGQICIQQCVSEKSGWVTGDGTPNADSISKFLRETFAKESWLLPHVEKIVSSCVTEVKAANANPVEYNTEGLKICLQAGVNLAYCLVTEIQLNCPADQIEDKAACDNLQERLKKRKEGL